MRRQRERGNCVQMDIQNKIQISIHTYIHTYIHIYGHHPPPHDRPSPSKHRSHRRVRAFSGVSSLSPPNVSVKNHPTTQTKKPKLHGECWNSLGFFVFWFFGFLVFCCFWFFGSLVFLLFQIYNPLHNKTKKNNKEPKKQNNKEPKKQKKTHKNKKKTVPAIFVELWFFGFLVPCCILVSDTASVWKVLQSTPPLSAGEWGVAFGGLGALGSRMGGLLLQGGKQIELEPSGRVCGAARRPKPKTKETKLHGEC